MDDNDDEQDTQPRLSTSYQQHRRSARGRAVVYKDADDDPDGEEDVDVDADADGDPDVDVDGEPGIATGRNGEDTNSNAALEDQIGASAMMRTTTLPEAMGHNIVSSPSNSTAGGSATPGELDEDVAPPRASARGNQKKQKIAGITTYTRTRVVNEQVEPEGSVSIPSDGDPAASSENKLASTAGSALSGTSGSARPMTTCQAVLASMVFSAHLSVYRILATVSYRRQESLVAGPLSRYPISESQQDPLGEWQTREERGRRMLVKTWLSVLGSNEVDCILKIGGPPS
ncbi:hypothetical protein FA15DRAFT_709230 [Coprinopsis marcescibilis]|uniref:Uncharacterized protein n=1 Tax=Coprinopsis marcescibilis TaxID=230819 RepID=A0A5C3KGE5_COPMA|nr:hypothetical protein FA15DRAFT_709230 [Coprinopsis marcescibilis]